MQITDVTIDRFCGLKDVHLGPFSTQLNVICGRPGSGKSTIARFLREMLFGIETPDTETSSASMGTVQAQGVWGTQTIERVVSKSTRERLVFDGNQHEDQPCSHWLPRIESTVFDHVFAFGFHRRPSLSSLVGCLTSHGFQLSHTRQHDHQLADLRGRRESLHSKLQSLEVSWDSLKHATRQLRADVDAIHWDPPSGDHQPHSNKESVYSTQTDRWSADLRRMDRDLEAHRERRLHWLRDELQDVERQISELERQGNSSLLQQASRWFTQLTSTRQSQRDRHICVRDGEIWLENAYGQKTQPHQMEAAELDQLYLAICLATVNAYRKQNVALPMIMDDVCHHVLCGQGDFERHSDQHSIWAENTASVLAEFSRAGHQVIVTTQHERLAELLQLNGSRVFRLTPVAVDNPQPALPSQETRRRWTWQDVTGSLNHHIDVTVPKKWNERPRQQAHHVANRVPPAEQRDPRYFLKETDDIIDVPSIGATDASHLRSIGIRRVHDLMRVDVDRCARALSHAMITRHAIERWQAEANLGCNVADLHRFDAQVLAECGIRDPQRLARMGRDELSQRVEALMQSDSGRALFQSGTRHERDRIKDWVENVHRTESVRPGHSGHQHYRDHAGQHEPVMDNKVSPARVKPGSAAKEAADEPPRQTVKMDDHRTKKELRHYLATSDPVVDAPSIGARMSERLAAINIITVDDLLQANAADVAERIDTKRVKQRTVEEWQQQTTLCCRIPEMRGHDAQVLVACGVTTTEELAATDAQTLWARVGPFVETKEGKRIIRNGKSPDLAEVTDWIHWARHARRLDQAA